MDWHPLTLAVPARPHVSGGAPIRERLGEGDVLVGYPPDLERGVRRPLAEAGCAASFIATSGEGL